MYKYEIYTGYIALPWVPTPSHHPIFLLTVLCDSDHPSPTAGFIL